MQKVITYVAGFVYEKSLPKTGNAALVPDTLQYALHEEGRIRWSITQTGSSFVYDYFLKDHLGNIRSVITDETRADAYPYASLEDVPLANEKNYYTNLDIGRKNKTTVPGYPTNDATTNPNNYIQELNGNTTKTGAGMFIKVMAGDKLNVSTSYWYPATFTSAPNVSPLTDLVTAIASGVSGESGGKLLESQLNTTVLSPSITGFLNNRDAGNNITKPKAYLNVVLLDEQL